MDLKNTNGLKMMTFNVPEIAELQFGLAEEAIAFRSHTQFTQEMERIALLTQRISLDYLPNDTVIVVPFDAMHVAAAVVALEGARDDTKHNGVGAAKGTVTHSRGDAISHTTNSALLDIENAVGGPSELSQQISVAMHEVEAAKNS
jgi:hypothetical protein